MLVVLLIPSPVSRAVITWCTQCVTPPDDTPIRPVPALTMKLHPFAATRTRSSTTHSMDTVTVYKLLHSTSADRVTRRLVLDYRHSIKFEGFSDFYTVPLIVSEYALLQPSHSYDIVAFLKTALFC